MKPVVAVPATAALVYRAWSRNSLTPVGIVVAAATAVAHAVHPWSVFFALLVVFFLAGTAATKVKHDVKSRLTQSSSGASGGEGPRNHIQVLANSGVASVLILLHAWDLHTTSGGHDGSSSRAQCWAPRSDVLVVGIVANYAAVAADTFSSELGILSPTRPRLVTAPWRAVAPGTNGGVTATGLAAGALGALVIALTSVALTPFCSSWTAEGKAVFAAAVTGVGVAGSLLDSLLGALLQASVVDVRTGKVVEGEGGRRVPVHAAGSLHLQQRAKLRSGEGARAVAATSGADHGAGAAKARAGEKAGSIMPGDEGHHESRRIETGWDVLSNNGVNLVMAASASVGAMAGAALLWGVPLSSVLPAVV